MERVLRVTVCRVARVRSWEKDVWAVGAEGSERSVGVVSVVTA